MYCRILHSFSIFLQDSNNSPVEQRHFKFVDDETISSSLFRQWLSQRAPVLTGNCCQHDHMFLDKCKVFKKLALQNRNTVNLCLILKMAFKLLKLVLLLVHLHIR